MGNQSSQPVLSLDRQRERFAPVYALLEQAVAARIFPGAAFGMLAGREVVALDAVGRQTYDETSPLVFPSTMYDLASVTKVMATTAMAMLLHERGVLHLDSPLASILPAFAAGVDRSGIQGRQHVTIRHLLAHASGLPGYARLFETARDPESLLQACLELPLEYAPGTHAEYSDIGFILLGKALEAIAGESLDAFYRREVFTPCGLESASFLPPAALHAAIPPTEDDTSFRHRVLQGDVQDENCFVLGGIGGHAGLFANALDVLRFASAILEETLVRPQTLQLFGDRAELPPGSSRALGWDTPSSTETGPSSSGTLFSSCSIGHLGYSGTSLWIDLEAHVAIVLLSNRTWPDRTSQTIRGFRPVFHDALRKSLPPGINLR